MSDYNGWTNWATWNANLWVDNDYDIYQRKISSERFITKWTEATSKDFFLQQFPEGTPDMDPLDLDEIDWEEIAENWNED